MTRRLLFVALCAGCGGSGGGTVPVVPDAPVSVTDAKLAAADAPPPDARPILDAPIPIPDARPAIDARPPALDAPPPDACVPTVTGDPTTLFALHQKRTIFTGTCFTPNSDVSIEQFSGWFTPCRGLIVVPGTTSPVDANGNFTLQLPNTALAFTNYIGPVSVTFDDVGGKSSTVNMTYIDGGAADTFVGPSTPSLAISAVAAGEHGSGTVKVATSGGAHGNGSFRTDFVIALAGAKASTTYTVFLDAFQQCVSYGTATNDTNLRSYGTLMTDGAGNASDAFHSYIDGDQTAGYFTPVLSLTSDGQPPGAGNVAYQVSITMLNGFDQSQL